MGIDTYLVNSIIDVCSDLMAPFLQFQEKDYAVKLFSIFDHAFLSSFANCFLWCFYWVLMSHSVLGDNLTIFFLETPLVYLQMSK